ncbi:MAG: UDP-glucose/GDP-mannose dehydrogenase family protein [Rhodobiaceae bacterium]|nr:UDP-glucose/GDP-mannose dehydrogenase family protein [Rhodobiaceae bacterium]MCC0049145.1 UDP-glucose/GDP-mannose dehydrogenase family protein [Rhodobiaceae bacterium]
MRICMIGAGYVGLVSGACFSEFGFNVACIDLDNSKIESLNNGIMPIYEPGLDDLVARNVEAGRLSFTTDFDNTVADSDVIFIAVGTPSRRGDGEADLEFVYAAARDIARVMKPGAIVVTKSTVVVGTNRRVAEIIRENRPGVAFSVASNPEFLREGSAIEDFMRPDRVVIGVEDEAAETALRRLYRPLSLRDAPLVVTSLENAEITKYAANAFLAMKVTFINEVANLCEAAGGNVREVASAIGLDKRIGPKFLHAGPGFGGSCFPKDTRAFAATGKRYGARQTLIEQVIDINEARKTAMAERVLENLDNPSHSTVAVLGIAFKPNTDDIREAPSLAIIGRLLDAGVTVRAHDPEAMENAQKVLDRVTFCDTELEAATGADAVVIVTEWNAYRGMDLGKLAGAMRGDKLIDLRNVFQPQDVDAAGLKLSGVGHR